MTPVSEQALQNTASTDESDENANIPAKPRMDLPKIARALNAQILEIEDVAGDSASLIRDLRFAVVNAVTSLENDISIAGGHS